MFVLHNVNMHKIDLKDRKILYELDLNCRQSNTQIGKKVGLKRDVVSYRINRLQEEGVIKNFWTALVVAIVYSIINFLTGWLLTLIALPFIIITFGLFKLVINAFMLWLTDKILDDFKIDGLLYTFIAAILITIIDSLIKWVL